MKKLLFLLLMLIAIITKGQNKETVGYMVYGDDEMMHYYIGTFITQYVEKKYPAPYDFSKTMTKEADKFLSKFTQYSIVHIDDAYFKTYVEKKKSLRNKEFKLFREEWYNELVEKYGIKKLIVFRNRGASNDYVGNSKHPIYGYGLYNGVYKGFNFVYFRVEALVFDKPRPQTFCGMDASTKNKTFPRLITADDTLKSEQLSVLVQPINELISKQFDEFMSNYEFRNSIVR